MLGFNSFISAAKLIAGIETLRMIAKRQMSCPGGLATFAAQKFYSLAM